MRERGARSFHDACFAGCCRDGLAQRRARASTRRLTKACSPRNHLSQRTPARPADKRQPDGFLKAQIGSRVLRSLSAGDVRWALQQLAPRFSRRSLQITRNCLERAIRQAQANDLVGRNVAVLVSPLRRTGRARHLSRSSPRRARDGGRHASPTWQKLKLFGSQAGSQSHS